MVKQIIKRSKIFKWRCFQPETKLKSEKRRRLSLKNLEKTKTVGNDK